VRLLVLPWLPNIASTPPRELEQKTLVMVPYAQMVVHGFQIVVIAAREGTHREVDTVA
jgi:hypothetical protein